MASRSTGMSRRGFLQRSSAAAGAALAFPTILPSSVFGANAPSKRITMASIGIGGMGGGLLNGFLGRTGETHFLAVCDTDAKHMANAKNQIDQRNDNSDCKTYRDFRDIIARDDIDAVVIATPDHWHAIPCILAAESGKDIYCEKPLTHDLLEGRAVVQAVQRHGRVFQTGSWQRSGGQFLQACELVRNGAIGKVHHIEVGLPDGGDSPTISSFPQPPAELDWNQWVGPAPRVPYHPSRCHGSWRWWLDFGGGQLMDWVGHHGDIAHMGMGWDTTGPVRIEPLVWDVPEKGNLYNAAINYNFLSTYADGVTMNVGNMRVMPEVFSKHGDTGTMWFGENGRWIWVSRGGIRANPDSLLKTRIGGSDFRFYRAPGGHHGDFLESIVTRRDPIAHAEAGHRSASIGHLGMIACKLNATLTWDPAQEQFAGNEAANRLLGRASRGIWSQYM